MFNSTSNSSTHNETMPGAMPGAMPGSMPQENNDTQFEQQRNENTHGGKTDFIPTQEDGHRSLLSHHKGLGNNNNTHNLTDAATGIAGNELNSHHHNASNPLNSNTTNNAGGLNNLGSGHGLESGARDTGFASSAQEAIDAVSGHHNQQPTSLNNNTDTHSGIPSSHDNKNHLNRDTGIAGLAHNEYKDHQNSTNDPLHASSHDANPLRNEHSLTGDNTNNNHHFGRDAALAGGAAGAAGLAGKELKDHKDHSSSLNNSIGHNNSNPLHHDSTGINSSNPLHHESVGHNNANPLHNTSSGINSSNPLHHDSTHQSGLSHENKDHHYGRDAALAGGAAGLAHHELKDHKNHNNDSLNNSTGHHTTNPLHHDSTGINSSNPLHHESAGHNSANPLHNASTGVNNSNPLHHDSARQSGLSHDNKDHHYGRDAALAGGAAGAAGIAGKELKDHNNHDGSLDNSTGQHNANPLHHDSTGVNSSNPLHHNSTGINNSNPLHHDSARQSGLSRDDKDHHYGRDAALAGGAAGLAHHELKDHKNHNDSLNNTAGHNNSNPLHYDSTGLNNSNRLHHNSTGVNSSNPRHDSTHQSGLSHDNKDHHYGRNAALAGGAAGAAGLAGKELKDHNNHDGSLNNATGHHNTNPLHHDSTGVNSSNPLHHDSTHQSGVSQDGKDHHYGRDAALAGGAAGLAHHELKDRNNHDGSLNNATGNHNTNPLHHDSTGVNNSNPLHHDSARQSAVSQDDKDHHYGRDAALAGGAAGLAHHELKDHNNHNDSLNNTTGHNSANPLHHDSTGANSSSNPLHHNSTRDISQDGKDHHYGRDAALAGGAAGLAHHELKDHKNKDSLDNTTGHNSANPLHHDPTRQSGLSHDNKDHHGRDAALAGGAAGAAGLAGKEMKDHHDAKRDSTVSGTSSHSNKSHHSAGHVGPIVDEKVISTSGGLTGKQEVKVPIFKEVE